MRKYYILFAVIAMIFGAMLLSGCAQNDPDLVGAWTWEDDHNWVTTFNEDGSGRHALDWGYGTTFTWTTSRNNINWNYPNHPQVYTPYSIVGNILTITMGDGITVYRYVRNP